MSQGIRGDVVVLEDLPGPRCLATHLPASALGTRISRAVEVALLLFTLLLSVVGGGEPVARSQKLQHSLNLTTEGRGRPLVRCRYVTPMSRLTCAPGGCARADEVVTVWR
jgi:hypothetical protein